LPRHGAQSQLDVSWVSDRGLAHPFANKISTKGVSAARVENLAALLIAGSGREIVGSLKYGLGS
jgi:hypothetical protein